MPKLNKILAGLKSDYDKVQAQLPEDETVASQRNPPPLSQALAKRGRNMALALAKQIVQDPTNPVPNFGIGGSVIRPQDIVLPHSLEKTGDSKLDAILKSFDNYYKKSWARPNDAFVKAIDEGKKITHQSFTAEPWKYTGNTLPGPFKDIEDYDYLSELLATGNKTSDSYVLNRIKDINEAVEDNLLRHSTTNAKTLKGSLYEALNDFEALNRRIPSEDDYTLHELASYGDEDLQKLLESDYFRKHQGKFDIYRPGGPYHSKEFKGKLAAALPHENYLTETRQSLPDFANSVVNKFAATDNLKRRQFLSEGLNEAKPYLSLGDKGTWYELPNEKATWAEGEKQSHCMGGYCPSEVDRLFSFRKDKNTPILSSHMSKDLDGFHAMQTTGFANRSTSFDEISLIQLLKEHLNK